MHVWLAVFVSGVEDGVSGGMHDHHNVVNPGALEMTHDVVPNLVLNTASFLIGVPTNILSCIVFYRQGLKDRMNLCLFSLAFVDTVRLISATVQGFGAYIEFWDEALAQEYQSKMLVYVLFIVYGMRAASGCITLLVAVERCVCVVFPLRASSFMKTRTTGMLLAALVVIFNLAFSILCFRNKVVRKIDSSTGRSRYVIVVADFFVTHQVIYDVLYNIILTAIVPIVTVVVVGIATAITVLKLRSAIAWRASTSSGGKGDNASQRHQMALTKMLVIVSCFFMACAAPLTLLSVMQLAVPDYSAHGRYSSVFFISHYICLCMVVVNSAVNFFVYYFQSSRFRRELHVLCGCGDAKKQVRPLVSETTQMSEF
nr:hypothetical protein BaRGS_029640 [Batillaria attramentaria]